MEGIKIIRWDGEKPTIKMIKSSLDDEGLDYYLFVTYPEDKFEEHKHDNHEIRIVAEGKMEFEISGKKFVLEAGDRIEMKPGIKHSAKSLYSGRTVCFAAKK